MAPDPLFANALLWLLDAGAALAFLGAMGHWRPRYLGLPLILAVVLAATAEFAVWGATHLAEAGDISLTGWQPVYPSFFTPRTTDSGLLIVTCATTPDGLNWEGPIPATPEFNPALAYRDPSRPTAGFKMK